MIGLWTNGSTFTFASGNGIHWRPLQTDQPAYTGSDTQQVALYDSSLGRYVAYRRVACENSKGGHCNNRACQLCVGDRCGEGAPAVRQVGRCVSDDFVHWPNCVRETNGLPVGSAVTPNCSLVFSFDEHDHPCEDVRW